MSSGKTMEFVTDNLGKEAALVLTFDGEQDASGKSYIDYFPVVYRVLYFPAEGPAAARVDVVSQLAFAAVQLLPYNNSVVTSTYVDIAEGLHTSLRKEDGILTFSPAEKSQTQPIPPSSVIATNETDAKQMIALGFDSNGSAKSLVVFNVDPGQSATIKFNPRLRVYVTSKYQESAVLRGPVSVRPILDVDVSQIGESMRFALTYDATRDTFSLNTVD